MPRQTKLSDPGSDAGGVARVAVDRVHSDTAAERWVFWYFDDTAALVLDHYFILERESRRHSWKIDKEYERLGRSRDFASPPPMPADVCAEAWQKFTKKIRVVMWENRY